MAKNDNQGHCALGWNSRAFSKQFLRHSWATRTLSGIMVYIYMLALSGVMY